MKIKLIKQGDGTYKVYRGVRLLALLALLLLKNSPVVYERQEST